MGIQMAPFAFTTHERYHRCEKILGNVGRQCIATFTPASTSSGAVSSPFDTSHAPELQQPVIINIIISTNPVIIVVVIVIVIVIVLHIISITINIFVMITVIVIVIVISIAKITLLPYSKLT